MEDPGETRNLIAEPAYEGQLLALRERMLAWYMETCDVVQWHRSAQLHSGLARAAGRWDAPR